MKQALLTDWKYYHSLSHANISACWKWPACLCCAGDSRWHSVPSLKGLLGHVCGMCFDALIPGSSHFKGSQRLHTLAEEKPILWVHSKWIDLKHGFLLLHSSKLILGCFSLKTPSSSRPNTSTSIRNVWLLQDYKTVTQYFVKTSTGEMHRVEFYWH